MTGMPYADFLNAIVDDGVEEARDVFAAPSKAFEREGAMRGCEECRGLGPDAVMDLLVTARRDSERARVARAPDAAYWRQRELKVMSTLNVLCAGLSAGGRSVPFRHDLRGMLKAARIVGLAVREPNVFAGSRL